MKEKLLSLVLFAILMMSMFATVLPVPTRQGRADPSSRSLGTGLVGYWNFNEGSGTIAHDSSTSLNDGTIYGANWAAGQIADGLSFSGTATSYVEVPSSPSLNVSTAITLEAWINFSAGGTLNPRIISKDSGAWGLFTNGVSSSRTMAFEINGHVLSSLKTIVAGKWYFVVGTYDGAQMKVYIDGSLDNSLSLTGPITVCPDAVNLGRLNDPNHDSFKGLIDEVKVFNRSLDATEIMLEYTMMNGQYPDLSVSASDIQFSNLEPKDNDIVTITVTVRNPGLANATNVRVKFLDNTTHIGQDAILQFIAKNGGTGQAQVSWTATKGTHAIQVIVDPDNIIGETNELNNNATKDIVVKAKSTKPSTTTTTAFPWWMLVLIIIVVIVVIVVVLMAKRK